MTKLKDILSQYFYALRIVWISSRKYTLARLTVMGFKALLPLLQLYFFKLLIDLVSSGIQMNEEVRTEVVNYLFIIGFTMLLNAIVQSISQYIEGLQQQKVSDYVAGMLQRKSLEVDLELYDDPDFHDSYFLAQRHGGHAPIQLVLGFTQLAENLITVLLVGGFIFIMHPLVSGLLLISVLPSTIIKYIFSSKLFKWEKKRSTIEREGAYLNHIITDHQFAKEVRIFNSGLPLSKKFIELKRILFSEKRTLFNLRIRMSIGGKLIEVVAEIFSYVFLTFRAFNGLISIGDLAIFLPLFQKGKSSLSGALQATVNLLEHRMFLFHLRAFMLLKPKIIDSQDDLPAAEPIQAGIELVKISFQYPQTESKAINNISLDLLKGQVTALVGNNGSGKSTLVKLIARLYDPTQGAIYLDGKDYKSLRLSDLRSKMSITFQDFAKFYLTIEENIRLSDLENKIHRKAEDFAQLTGADEFIQKLPMGYQQRLGRVFGSGTELSIGQWQKIALARMFFNQAEIIIADEPTSAIDPLTEHIIFEALKEMAKDKIVILVTHRLYNLKIADKIVVMEEGEIVESGTHDELISQEGKYSEMISRQL
ncbi:ABC transporter ATP-binding protein [Roseivirga sp. E12]|uniref:ABC transporter ATP-binding protein n=1 Tax=Roseivirga sp. E12 TaxID=2819237 RepID=UPI001ABD2670|nr:ABC transporter ATP-binding protein [Roseivirga sp. E12]MBO3699067.1 ABC transporter ATP-binding protein [Roseivirga sp. E12]